METKLGPWLLRRLLCCTGFLVFLQNLMLLHWTAQIRLPNIQHTEAAPSTTHSSEATEASAAPSTTQQTSRSENLKAHMSSLDTKLASRQLGRESSLFQVSRSELRIFGEPVPETVSFTVGFGSVKRQKDYVTETVGIMLGLKGDCEITAEERSHVVIVAHFADFNSTWVTQITGKLMDEYQGLVQGGQFHGIHANEEQKTSMPRLGESFQSAQTG